MKSSFWSYIIDTVTGEGWHAFEDGQPKKIWQKVR